MTGKKNIQFEAYGDESVSNNAVIFGLVIVQSELVGESGNILAAKKESYDVPREAELHCKYVFPSSARQNTPWQHLTDEKVFEFSASLVESLKSLGPNFRIGFLDKREWPKKMPELEWRKKLLQEKQEGRKRKPNLFR